MACGGGESDLASDPNLNISALGSTNTDSKPASDGTDNNSATENTNNTGSSTSSVSATNPADYVWTTLTNGAKVYIDRDYTYTSIPFVYDGVKVLQTANNDKASTGTTFISFNIEQAMTVYVAYSRNATKIPGWLSSWTKTGDVLSTSDRDLFIFKKDFAAGTVITGGNDGAQSMYTVFLTTGDTSSKTGGNTGSTGTSSGSTSGSNTGSTSTNGNTSTGSATVTGSATLTWSKPTRNIDNTTLYDLAGYKIYYGKEIGTYSNSIVIPNPNTTSYVLNKLTQGTWYFVITAYDFSGNSSPYSMEVFKQIQ